MQAMNLRGCGTSEMGGTIFTLIMIIWRMLALPHGGFVLAGDAMPYMKYLR